MQRTRVNRASTQLAEREYGRYETLLYKVTGMLRGLRQSYGDGIISTALDTVLGTSLTESIPDNPDSFDICVMEVRDRVDALIDMGYKPDSIGKAFRRCMKKLVKESSGVAKKRKLNEYDGLGYRSDTVSTALDWISENVIEWVEDEERKAELQEVVDQIYDLFDRESLRYSSSYSDLGNDPLNLLEKLAVLVNDEGYELCSDFILEQVENQRKALKATDYENGRDPELDTDEPLFDIYCTYSDEQGGECDGDPRYEKVSFDDLYDTIVDIGRDFLSNNLKGSYRWSPVDREISEEDIIGISTGQWKSLDDESKNECTINRLKIIVEPVQATEDTYTVVISGRGRIVKDTYGGIEL